MAWTSLTGGWGIDFQTFSGPFLSFWAFGQYLLPLALLELYFAAVRGSALLRLASAALVFASAVVTGVGVFAAVKGMWLPRLLG